jgi:hypothetical protein
VGNTFNLESKIIRQMTAFVIAPEEPERIWIPNLQRPKIQDALRIRRRKRDGQVYFNGKISSIHIVAKEKISRFRRVAAHLEEFHEIVVLTVNVATHWTLETGFSGIVSWINLLLGHRLREHWVRDEATQCRL